MGDFKLKLQRGLLSGLLVCATPVFAQDSLANLQAAERAEDARSAYSLIESGDSAYGEEDYPAALTKYNEALTMLPEGAEAVSAVRQLAVQRHTLASLAQAQNLKRRGDYDGVERLLMEVERYSPDNPLVAKFRGKVEDPIRTNPALTARHAANIDKVRRLLYEAQGFHDLGQFDRAEMTFEDVLRIDPYNKAARRGMERAVAARTDYYQAARDEARATLLGDIDGAWEMEDHQEILVPLVGYGSITDPAAGTGLYEKLETFIIPEMVLNDATLEEAVDYLRAVSLELDKDPLGNSSKGVDFIIQLGDDAHPAVQAVRARRITLQLKSVPIAEALRQVTAAVDASFRIDEYAVVISAAGFSDPTLIRREFRVPPDFLTATASGGADASGDPFGEAQPAGGALIARTLSATEKLKSFDLPFPEGATASYNASSNILTVRNTAENLAMVDSIVKSVSLNEPVVVSINISVIDINQSDLEELGFDTMLGELGLGNLILSGGTTGTGVPIEDMIAGNPVSSGLRSGELAGTSDGLDALIARESPKSATGSVSSGFDGSTTSTLSLPSGGSGSALRASGVISLRARIDNSGHEILMRALSQKKGTDLLIRPQVVTQPGQNAVVQSILLFPYPLDYEPPQIPNSVESGDGIVTPATPTSFTTEELGVSLEVLPEVGPDRQIIEVQLSPVIRDFEGFVNYGTPITGSTSSTTIDFVAGSLATNSTFGEITPNQILKPVFRVIRSKSTIRILDGETIVMGGLLQEVRKNVNDKVPILGDLPLVGRIFRNDAISVEKRSVLIFVNVELLDPAGNPYRKR